jgi:hypothetical protein
MAGRRGANVGAAVRIEGAESRHTSRHSPLIGAQETDCADCVAARTGLEPMTFGLGNRCSILLSYRAAGGRS